MTRKSMSFERTGGDCCKVVLIIYTLFFWLSGLGLIFIGLWMLLDPKRNYVLELVNFSEDDPLLTFASVISIVAGIVTLLVGFIGCCGAIKRMRCLLVGFILCLVGLFLADASIGILALVYRNKFSNGQMPIYLKNLTFNRYHRDKWVQPLLDTIQYYIHSPNSTLRTHMKNLVKFQYGVSLELEENARLTTVFDRLQFNEECCGSVSSLDYDGSRWKDLMSSVPDQMKESYTFQVPTSCCLQVDGASAMNPVPQSMSRCQTAPYHKKWRHSAQHCCGGEGPRDYYDSFWFITNTERGTRSFVPRSCCIQSQKGRAWNLIPIDPMCTTYEYSKEAFRKSVHTDGCHEKMLHWFNTQSYIFAGVGFGTAAVMVIGICITLLLCNGIHYTQINDDYD